MSGEVIMGEFIINEQIIKKMETREKVIEMMLRYSEKSKEEIREEDDLYNDLGFDSLDTVELTMDMEKELGVSIDEDYPDKWRTVKDVLDTVKFLILKKVGGGSKS